MQGDEERRLRCISNTPQGEAIDGNAADDALMVDQGNTFQYIVKGLKKKPPRMPCPFTHTREAAISTAPTSLFYIPPKAYSFSGLFVVLKLAVLKHLDYKIHV
jgi:hypothetical protein